jgi:hypothetical protein
MINLSMRDQEVYETIKNLADHGGNKKRAALTLGCSSRTVDRHIAGYKAEGKAYFVHGNSGRQPAHTLDEKVKLDMHDLYLFKQILTTYGIPYMFCTDRRAVFEYRKSGSQDAAADSLTQFSLLLVRPPIGTSFTVASSAI